MTKHSAFTCPECGQKTLKVMRTLLASPTRRVRFYSCVAQGCYGGGTSEENITMGQKDADVHETDGQPDEAPW